MDPCRPPGGRLDRSIAWYEHFTPLRLIDRREDDVGQGAWLAHPEATDRPFVLVLVMFNARRGTPQPQLAPFAHLGIELPSQARGRHRRRPGPRPRAAWPGQPQQLPPPVGYVCAASDPDGNVVEFSFDQGVAAKVARDLRPTVSSRGLPTAVSTPTVARLSRRAARPAEPPSPPIHRGDVAMPVPADRAVTPARRLAAALEPVSGRCTSRPSATPSTPTLGFQPSPGKAGDGRPPRRRRVLHQPRLGDGPGAGRAGRGCVRGVQPGGRRPGGRPTAGRSPTRRRSARPATAGRSPSSGASSATDPTAWTGPPNCSSRAVEPLAVEGRPLFAGVRSQADARRSPRPGLARRRPAARVPGRLAHHRVGGGRPRPRSRSGC